MAKTENGFILALDQGTTSSRSIIFDSQLTPIAIAQKPLGIITPKAGFIEQNANDIWQTQISTAQEVIAKAGLLATDISAIGITNQRETTIIWHKRRVSLSHPPLSGKIDVPISGVETGVIKALTPKSNKLPDYV